MHLRRTIGLNLLATLACPALVRAQPASSPTVPDAPPPLPAPTVLSTLEQTLEVLRLKQAMARDVPRAATRPQASDAATIDLARAELAAAAATLERPQVLVVVDRNPKVQQLTLVMAAPADEWRVVGATRVSTGSTGRFDHYITPRGVFRNTTAILGFRAEGTPNENGVRGLGGKGMRVWDFGWHVAAKGWDAGPGKPDRTPIRLMLHATDPDKLEARIGRPASQGCVRVPTALNRFLDVHGLLDGDYERAAATEVRFRALLLPERTPSTLAGNTMVVVDSGDKAGMNVASRTIP